MNVVIGEQVAASPGQRFKRRDDGEGLARQRHLVIVAHLHLLGGDQPYPVRLVEFGPLG
jgi:hypothetical protein